MSSNKVNKITGELVTLANGMRCWIGTKAAHDAAEQAGTLPNNCLLAILDDWQDATVDVVEDGNMHPVTSNAVSAALSGKQKVISYKDIDVPFNNVSAVTVNLTTEFGANVSTFVNACTINNILGILNYNISDARPNNYCVVITVDGAINATRKFRFFVVLE